MSEVLFFNEQCSKPSFFSSRKTKKWLEMVAKNYACELGAISFIFCNDDYLLDVNRKYLNHDYYTDIITFDYREGDILSGDIFISLNTVRSNAKEFGVTFKDELHRVIVHGVLHLIGFNDESEEDSLVMRENENKCLELLKTL